MSDPEDKVSGNEPQIRFAAADHIHRHPAILEEFMSGVVGLPPGNYLLSDESLLTDFESNWLAFAEKIDALYGLDISASDPQPYIWEIIELIVLSRRASPAS